MAYYTRPTTSYGGARPVTLRVPNAYDPAKQYPLVLVLHSYGATGTDIVTRLGLTDAPQFHDGALVLAPEGQLDGANQFWNYWTTGAGSDFEYLSGLIESVQADWPVDPSRVFVVGYSNGGFMAHQLCLEYPDLFTSKFTLAAGSGVNDTTDPATTDLPAVNWHGQLDATVAYAGDGAASTLPGILAGHGGVGSVGYIGATGTTNGQAQRNGGAGGNFGANYGSINFVTADGAGAETDRHPQTDLTADGVAVELWTAPAIDHSISLAGNAGCDYLYAWMYSHYRAFVEVASEEAAPASLGGLMTIILLARPSYRRQRQLIYGHKSGK